MDVANQRRLLYRIENNPIDSELREELKRGQVVFLVGAGISLQSPSNLPLAGGLIREVIAKLSEIAGIDDRQRSRLIALICSRLRPEVVFDVLYSEVGSVAFQILGRLGQGRPNIHHLFLARMLSFGNDILTTNYDVQIERALTANRIQIRKVVSPSAFQYAARHPQARGGRLYKLHGSLKVNGRLPSGDSLVAAMRQVGSGLSEAKAKILETLLRKKHLVVLGYSGRDEFDIVPKLTGTSRVKHVHWVVHWIPPIGRTARHPRVDQYLCQLLDNIDGPTRLIYGRTDDYIRLLQGKSPRLTKNPSNPTFAPSRSSKWDGVSQSTAFLLVGDLLRRSNAPLLGDRYYRKLQPSFNSNPQLAAKATLRRAQSALDLGNTSDARDLIEQSLSFARLSKEPRLMAWAFNYLGILARKQTRWDSALTHYKRALRSARTIGTDRSLIENLYNNIGIVLEKKNRSRSALLYLKKGLRCARSSGDPESIGKSLNNLGIAYDNLGRYEESIACYSESLRLKELVGYKHGIAQTTHNLGVVYEHSGKRDLARQFYTRSLSLKKGVTHDEHGVAQTEANLARLLRQEGRLSHARELVQRAINVLRATGDEFGLAEALLELARIEYDSERFLDAETPCREALRLFQGLGIQSERVRCTRLIRKITRAPRK